MQPSDPAILLFSVYGVRLSRFDAVVKVDADGGAVVATWFEEGVYVTEADFVPIGEGEDDGVLLTVTYDRYIASHRKGTGPMSVYTHIYHLYLYIICMCYILVFLCVCVWVCRRCRGWLFHGCPVRLIFFWVCVPRGSATDVSSLAVLSAVNLSLQASYPLPGEPLSFHAHGRRHDRRDSHVWRHPTSRKSVLFTHSKLALVCLIT